MDRCAARFKTLRPQEKRWVIQSSSSTECLVYAARANATRGFISYGTAKTRFKGRTIFWVNVCAGASDDHRFRMSTKMKLDPDSTIPIPASLRRRSDAIDSGKVSCGEEGLLPRTEELSSQP